MIENYESNNKKSPLRLLFYALIEILLVLVGILLAVQIDSGITNRKNDKIRCAYLDELLIVIEEDISDVEGNISAFEDWNPKIREVAVSIIDGNLAKIDSLSDKLGTVGNYINFGQGSFSKIEELKYSPISLIENRKLKTKILKYQNVNISFLRDREKRYDQVGEDLRKYYTINFFGFNYQKAIPNDLESLANDREFLSLVRQRYEWNEWFRMYYKQLIDTQREIKELIIEEKEKNCT